MATSPEILAQLRRMAGETGSESVYSDDDLDAYITAGDGNLRAVAAQIWDEKAAKSAALVDVNESGSSRRLSQAYANALAMAKGLRDGDAAGETPPASGARVRPLGRL